MVDGRSAGKRATGLQAAGRRQGCAGAFAWGRNGRESRAAVAQRRLAGNDVDVENEIGVGKVSA